MRLEDMILILGWCYTLLIIDSLIHVLRFVNVLHVVQSGKNVSHNYVERAGTLPCLLVLLIFGPRHRGVIRVVVY